MNGRNDRYVFLRRLLSTVSAVDGGLPYNWNWQCRWSPLHHFLVQHPIVLMDVGARGDAPPELQSIRSYVRRVGFEPDAHECRRLNQVEDGEYFPKLVSGTSGRQTLNLYRNAGYSSTLRLSERYQRLWVGEVPIDGRLELDAVTIDSVVSENRRFAPDIIKVDTQGSELSILEGAEDTLKAVGLVEVEVEFLPMYEGQPLFGDVASFMGDHGFELLYLNRAFVTRRQLYSGPSRGQLLFGDALFGKREDCMGELSAEQRAKFTILLCQYGHLDIAWQLLEQCSPEIDELVPELRQVFEAGNGRVRRALLMQVDKILIAALHLRRHNQRGTDSDRCWPVR